MQNGSFHSWINVWMAGKTCEPRAIQPRVTPLVPIKSSLSVGRCAFAFVHLHFAFNQPPWSTQPGHPFVGGHCEYQRNGHITRFTSPVSVVSQHKRVCCDGDGYKNGDPRRPIMVPDGSCRTWR